MGNKLIEVRYFAGVTVLLREESRSGPLTPIWIEFFLYLLWYRWGDTHFLFLQHTCETGVSVHLPCQHRQSISLVCLVCGVRSPDKIYLGHVLGEGHR